MMLRRHLGPLSARIRNFMSMKNPLIREMKDKYPLSFAMAGSASTALNEHYGVLLSEDEIGYIAFSFALATERAVMDKMRKRVLLVCASGRGSEQFLIYKCRSLFSEYISRIDACDMSRLLKVDFREYDCVFTTTPLPVSVPMPIYELPYFPDENDIAGVKEFLSGDLWFPVERYYPAEMFLPHISARTKEEVLRLMCGHAMNLRKLPEDWERAVLERERTARTSFGSQVAFPRANMACGQQTFAVVGILDEAIEWSGFPVQVVVLVCIADREQSEVELQRFYRATVSFFRSFHNVQEFIKKKDFRQFLLALGEIDLKLPAII